MSDPCMACGWVRQYHLGERRVSKCKVGEPVNEDPCDECRKWLVTEEIVDHPPHYGGADNPYEAIKVIEAWGLGFHLGNAVKYISRAGKKDAARTADDLRKARWYIEREIERIAGKAEKPA